MSLEDHYPFYLANKASYSGITYDIFDKFSGEKACKVEIADSNTINDAISCAVEAANPMAEMAAYERQAILEHCVSRFKERFEEIAQILCIEAGKPIKDARGEVSRLIDTFKIASEESVRMKGELQNLDISPRSKNYRGMWKRVPIGPCSFISPFNFPLNLAAHKIAPAIAVGCPFVMKPASKTPIGALIIGETLSETELPAGSFSILPCERDGAELFTTDERLKLLSFTGSPEVGWKLKRQAGKKKVILELGGNAAVIIDSDANLADAAERIIFGAFYQSGQSCISVQRIIIHQKIYDEFKTLLIKKISTLEEGDPKCESTFIGPMISEKEAARLETWVEEALENGAKLLCGGKRKKSVMSATLMEKVSKSARLASEEAFGPIATIEKYENFEDALEVVNNSKFGLQAGVFTNDLNKALLAWDCLDVGGVIIGDVPSFRVDNMPYGGVKDSGLGREGVAFAMEDMTEIRNLVIRDKP